MRVPKGILNHPSVEQVHDAQADAFDEGVKFDVWLRDDWVFSAGSYQSCSSMRCNTVKDFLAARPVRRSEFERLA